MSADPGLSCAISFASFGVSVAGNHNLPEIVDPRIDKAKNSIAYMDLNKSVLG